MELITVNNEKIDGLKQYLKTPNSKFESPSQPTEPELAVKCLAFHKLFQRIVIESCFITKNKLSNKLLTFVVLSFSIWFLIWIVADKEALPGGLYFSLLILLYTGHVFGYLSEKIKLPPLFGIISIYNIEFLQFILF